MRETETQKNWNNFYKNPHPPKQHNFFILKLMILLTIAGAIIFYRYSMKEKGISNSISINANGIVIEEHGISNQNGVDMNISLNEIEKILENITKKEDDVGCCLIHPPDHRPGSIGNRKPPRVPYRMNDEKKYLEHLLYRAF